MSGWALPLGQAQSLHNEVTTTRTRTRTRLLMCRVLVRERNWRNRTAQAKKEEKRQRGHQRVKICDLCVSRLQGGGLLLHVVVSRALRLLLPSLLLQLLLYFRPCPCLVRQVKCGRIGDILSQSRNFGSLRLSKPHNFDRYPFRPHFFFSERREQEEEGRSASPPASASTTSCLIG